MKRRIAMLVLALGMCGGLAGWATTRALAMPQDDKMQSGDKMKEEKTKDAKMEKMKEKRSKMRKIEKKNKMEKKESKEKKDEPKS